MLSALMKTKEQPVAKTAQTSDRSPLPIRRPAVSIDETDTAYILIADMPGVAAEQVEVNIDKGVLTLRGSAAPVRPDGYEPLYREYIEAAFERRFELPAEVDIDGINATTRHGRVQLTLPKVKAVQPRRITVMAG
jgi:HSP20 family molecular chaperone IbpA